VLYGVVHFSVISVPNKKPTRQLLACQLRVTWQGSFAFLGQLGNLAMHRQLPNDVRKVK